MISITSASRGPSISSSLGTCALLRRFPVTSATAHPRQSGGTPDLFPFQLLHATAVPLLDGGGPPAAGANCTPAPIDKGTQFSPVTRKSWVSRRGNGDDTRRVDAGPGLVIKVIDSGSPAGSARTHNPVRDTSAI